MKHKLININTNEEHLCEKETINNFDYYVSDKIAEKGEIAIVPGYSSLVIVGEIDNMPYSEPTRHWQGLFCDTCFEVEAASKFKKVIATNNSNIDIPKVVNIVSEIVEYSESLTKSLYNPEAHRNESIKSLLSVACQSGYNKSQESHPFSKEDMINFYEWCDTSEEAYKFWRKNQVFPDMDGSHNIIIKQKRKELFNLWLNTRIQTIYYED